MRSYQFISLRSHCALQIREQRRVRLRPLRRRRLSRSLFQDVCRRRRQRLLYRSRSDATIDGLLHSLSRCTELHQDVNRTFLDSCAYLLHRSDHCVIASSGFQADIKAVHKRLQARNIMYQHQHNKVMSCPAMAQLVANTLYYRRFFPYYTSTICAGLNPEGCTL